MIETPKILQDVKQKNLPAFKFTLPKPYCEWQRVLMTSDVKFAMFVCGSKSGKALSVKEKIPTPNGWRTMGSLKKNDYVFDEYGKPVQILSTTKWMYDHVCYRVKFSEGSEIIADAEHLWETESHAERKNKARGLWLDRVSVRTTQEIKDTLMFKNRPNHAVKNVLAPLEYPVKNLPIDPYLLGVWLGDGTTNSGSVSLNSFDLDILKSIEESGWKLRRVPSAKSSWRIIDFTVKLDKCNFLGNKHVPQQYLLASTQQRLALLQGLMDTDGTANKKGGCSFYSSIKKISDAVETLVVSLGMKCTRTQKVGKLYGVKHKLCYMVNFVPNMPVFRTARKLARLRKPHIKTTRRTIVSVEQVKTVPVCCITVKSETHLFLAGRSCIPTHNSLAGACKIIHASYCANKAQDGLYRIIAPTYPLTGITYQYINRLCPDNFEQRPDQNFEEYRRSLEAWKSIKPVRTDSKRMMRWPHNGATIQCTHAQDPEVTIEGERTLGNVLDEMSKMHERTFSSVNSTTTQTNGWIRGYTTPRGKNWVWHKYLECLNEMELAKQNNRLPTMIAMTATTIDNPYVPRDAIEFARRTLPDRIFRQLYLAEFIDDGSTFLGFRQLIRGQEIQFTSNIQVWHKEGASECDVILGGDWARTHDFAVVTAWNAETKEMIGLIRFQGLSYKHMVKHVYDFGSKFRDIVMLKHDKTGIGDVIDELLQQLPWPVQGIKFNNENKSAMINQFMIDMQHAKFTLPNWPDMIRELDAYEVTVSPLGTMKYGAPAGMHDDIVTSMFLGWSAVVEHNPNGFDVQFLDSIKIDNIESFYDSLMDEDD
jgi:hypothetical protein